jgi:hypothetical protein
MLTQINILLKLYLTFFPVNRLDEKINETAARKFFCIDWSVKLEKNGCQSGGRNGRFSETAADGSTGPGANQG